MASGYKSAADNPLHIAAREGHTQIVEQLISIGADVNSIGEINDTPLHLAARQGHLQVAKLLISNEANVNSENAHHATPLLLALRKGRIKVAELLLSNGADFSKSLLVAAVEDNLIQMAEILLSRGADVNIADNVGETPLMKASEKGYTQLVEKLLSRGANVNYKDIKRETPLLKAAKEGYTQIIELLVSNGANLNSSNKTSETPLLKALKFSQTETAELLISRGANIKITDKLGRTPLLKAAQKGYTWIVELLLSRGANLHGADSFGDTPLIKAAQSGCTQVAELLLSKGAELNSVNKVGKNPLLNAVESGNTEMVELLLSRGADLNTVNDLTGDTPLHIALTFGHTKVAELLLTRGAVLNTFNKDGKTPIDLARSNATSRVQVARHQNKQKKVVSDLQKSIDKAKAKGGKVQVRFIKVLFTGSGASGKTSFNNLLMKKNIDKVHHSTRVVQTKHAISVKKALVVGSQQAGNSSVIWLEMDNNSEVTHIRQLLLSSKKSISEDTSNQSCDEPVQVPKHPKPTSHGVTHPSPSRSVTQLVSKRVTSLFSHAPKVKSKNLETFDTLVKSALQGSSSHSMASEVTVNRGKVLNIITLLDTGGQPEYIHLLPTVNIHPMITFVVHDLSKNLEDQVLVEYSEHGKHVFEPYHLKYSNFDMIKFLMCTINDSLEKPSHQVPQLVTIPGKSTNCYLCCVGTHADRVTPEIMHNTDNKLTAMVERLDCKASVWSNKDDGVLFSVDNTTAGDDNNEDPLAEVIRNKIEVLASDKDVYELPITWMLFELEIRQVCSNHNKSYISIQDCISIATKSNLISHAEEIKSALLYHHLLGVLLYYPEIAGLCDYVIVDHQWLFDRLTSIVRFTFKQSSNIKAANQLKYNGILCKELIEDLKWEEELKEEYFMSLLVEMKIIAPIRRQVGSGVDYFIPYVLPNYASWSQGDGILLQYGHLQGEPLLIQFMSNLLPRGVFCCLVVQLLQQLPNGWVHLHSEKDTYHSFSNLITFRLQNAYSLSLMDKLSFLEIQIRHPELDYYQHCPVHTTVQGAVANALEIVCEQLSYNEGRLQYGFYCQCGKIGEEHIAITKLTPPFDYALCRYGSVKATKLHYTHTLWLAENYKHFEEEKKMYHHTEVTSAPQTDHQSPEYKIFLDYYEKLSNILPISDLCPYFVSEKVISPSDIEHIIKSPTSVAAAKLALDRVTDKVKIGEVEPLEKMLLIMRQRGNDVTKIVSTELKHKLEMITHKDSAVQPDKEELLSPEYEVFIQYYSQIVNSMSAKALSPHFVAKHIISPGDQEEIFSIASSKKAAMLLLCRVSSALEFGIVDNFYKLLDIIEQYGNIDSRKVSLDIRKKLSCSTLDGKKIVCTLDEKATTDEPPDKDGTTT